MSAKKKNPKKKILIVEDEKPIMRTLQLKLENLGFDTLCASDGNEALAFLEEYAVDLVLLDIIMSNKDGFEVLRSIKKKIPVYVLTNLSQEEDAAICKNLGARRFFVKSETSLKDVVKHINELFV